MLNRNSEYTEFGVKVSFTVGDTLITELLKRPPNLNFSLMGDEVNITICL